MKRRKFITTAGLASAALGFSSLANTVDIKTARDLQNYLRSLYKVREPSVDRIVIGRPDTKIEKIGTAWMPYLSTLQKAVAAGVNVMVVHEPTFYTHWDLDKKVGDFYNAPSPAKDQYMQAVERKRQWIEDQGLVVIRSHDVPDILKNIGIPFAFGQALGFANEDIIASKDYYNVYGVAPARADAITRKVAQKLKELDQPGVAFYGDPARIVKSVGLGTGCICDPQQYGELQPDLSIGIDDTIRTWIQTTYAEDTGNPLIVVNHGTSEEMGMRLLSNHLKKNLAHFDVLHFNQGCSYTWITG